MIKIFKISFFGAKRLMTLKLGIQHRVLKYYHIRSNDDTGLTLIIFWQGQFFFPNTCCMKIIYQKYINYFASCGYLDIFIYLKSFFWHSQWVAKKRQRPNGVKLTLHATAFTHSMHIRKIESYIFIILRIFSAKPKSLSNHCLVSRAIPLHFYPLIADICI